MTTCERAAIAVSMEYKVPYMDKFGVIAEAKGEGIGSAIFHEMKKNFLRFFGALNQIIQSINSTFPWQMDIKKQESGIFSGWELMTIAN